MSASSSLPRNGERTVLRQLEEQDLHHFQAYRTDPQVARYQSWEQMTNEEALSFIRSVRSSELLGAGHWSQIGIADRPSGLLIGDIGVFIDREEQDAEIGFTLDRRYQRQGLGREAVSGAVEWIFHQTTVNRIFGITDERNIASIKLMEALGMETVVKEETVFRGEPCTEITFVLAR